MKFATSLALLASMAVSVSASAPAEVCLDTWAHDAERDVCSPSLGFEDWGWTNGRYGMSGCDSCECDDCPTAPPTPVDPPTAAPTPTPVPLPVKCMGFGGDIMGDPHVRTFDKLKYDCQGEGEFQVFKSTSSDFQMQSRFERFVEEKRPTSTKAVVWTTGYDGDVKIQVNAPNGPAEGLCLPDVYADDVLVSDPGSGVGDPNIQVKFIKKVKTSGYVFYYHDSGFQVTVKSRVTTENGCVLNVKICLPYDWERTKENIVGLTGTPDGVEENEWTEKDGNVLTIPATKLELKEEKAYNYCVDNWCIREEAKSIFHYLDGESHAGFDECGLGVDPETTTCLNSPDTEIYDLCGEGLECRIDGCAGGGGESKQFIDDDKDMNEAECGREVFFESFDSPYGHAWGEIVQGSGSKFLAMHRDSPVWAMEFDVPAKADMIIVEFLFYEIGHWEAANEGTDWVHFFVGNTPLDLLGFAFDANKDNLQDYYEGYNHGLSWNRMAIDGFTDMGFGHQKDQMHKVTISVPQDYFEDGTLTLSFSLDMSHGREDEMGGVDDFRLTAYGVSCDIDEGIKQPRPIEVKPIQLPFQCDARVASIFGDPHIHSFDGINYDCQGEGEFTLAQSWDGTAKTGMEIQGRFQKFGTDQVSVMRAIAVQEELKQEDNAPTVQLVMPAEMVDGECKLEMFIGGTQMNPSSPFLNERLIVEDLGSEAVVMYYPYSQLQIVVLLEHSNKFGCFMALKLCVPEDYNNGDEIIGLLGTSDNNAENEWVGKDGQALPSSPKIGGPEASRYFKSSYDYCTENWCIREASDSIFRYQKEEPHSHFMKCDEPYEVTPVESCAKSPSSDVLDACGENMACIIDYCGGDITDGFKAVGVHLGLVHERGCGYLMLDETFQYENAKAWGYIENIESAYFLTFQKDRKHIYFTMGGIPEVADYGVLEFSLYDYHGFSDCYADPNKCMANKLLVTLGNNVTSYTTFAMDMFAVENIARNGMHQGIKWDRSGGASAHRVYVQIPKQWMENGQLLLQILAMYGGQEGDFIIGFDDMRFTAYADRCKDMKDWYTSLGPSGGARRHLAQGIHITEEGITLTPEGNSLEVSRGERSLAYEVHSEECTCICPEGFTTEAVSGPRTMELYVGQHSKTCDPLGESVGTVTLSPNANGTVTVHYVVEAGYSITETNLYAGDEALPGLTTGGALPVNEWPDDTGDHALGVTEYTYYDVDLLTCDFYLSAMAKVCGPFPPSPEPTGAPTFAPTREPTDYPTSPPNPSPTVSPTVKPTDFPTAKPTEFPTSGPTSGPTSSPSEPTPKTPPPVTGPPKTLAPTDEPVSPTPGASGDPHIMDWNGTLYDFHGACDLVLLNNPGFANGLGMQIHIRTEIDTWWSYIKTAVVRIGDDTFEVMGGEGLKYWINGKAGKTNLKNGRTLGAQLAGQYKIRFRWLNSKQHQFKIDLGNGEGILFKTFKQFVRVNLEASSADDFVGSSGLMGSFPGGVHYARDNSTVLEDVNMMGQEWQVQSSEAKMFHNIKGPQHPTQCTMPTETETGRKRRLGEAGITMEQAETACARVDAANRNACIFDVLATNDKDMAGSY